MAKVWFQLATKGQVKRKEFTLEIINMEKLTFQTVVDYAKKYIQDYGMDTCSVKWTNETTKDVEYIRVWRPLNQKRQLTII